VLEHKSGNISETR